MVRVISPQHWSEPIFSLMPSSSADISLDIETLTRKRGGSNNDSSSHLLSEDSSGLLQHDSMFSTGSRTGPGGDDLSLSELDIEDRTVTMGQPFSLLARPLVEAKDKHKGRQQPATEEDEEFGHDVNGEYAEDDVFGDVQAHDDEGLFEGGELKESRRLPTRTREEKLQSDLVVLRKLNASFAVYNDAMKDVGSANERVATQLEETEALLNQYIGLLSKSEEISRLILDEDWHGAEADQETVEREAREAEEKARREAEERALAARLEQERLQREEQEHKEREEKERLELERKQRAGTSTRGVVRGVRGTRASMRGVRGSGAGTARVSHAGTSSTGRVRSASGTTAQSSQPGSGPSAAGTRRPGSAAGGRPSGLPAPSRGTSSYRRS
ncbi:hypothetical protein BDN72DRAFT_516658 [Pluteus cervinus]|uniref:Uncharacterized protein n=1 Tax=Pluteus cervinus TaxID=181527 RepID=A0ACD3BC35_9AGAR|nr:hypothetical protein BDN72DRAFT_516658 [Pluteus cervinus]